ncbi:MAG: hypothetical protein KTR18_12400 [Acidiferrobacterales bacterium]|nr:hypothetical protein [Acidiferrobacterales bacterium]
MLNTIINLKNHPLNSEQYRRECKQILDRDGVLVMQGFLAPTTIKDIIREGVEKQSQAFYTQSNHNIYLQPADPAFPPDHPRNREVASSKGCITTDQISDHSALRALYNNSQFQAFLCAVLDETALYAYADPLSSINLHYASKNQELGWHFDNSSFAITLMIQEPEGGGVFEYVRDVRNADLGEMNYDRAAAVLDGKIETSSLSMPAGTLVLFRGQNSMHRVTPVVGSTTRMLVVLAYNTKPDISLSESARKTFYGRLE